MSISDSALLVKDCCLSDSLPLECGSVCSATSKSSRFLEILSTPKSMLKSFLCAPSVPRLSLRHEHEDVDTRSVNSYLIKRSLFTSSKPLAVVACEEHIGRYNGNVSQPSLLPSCCLSNAVQDTEKDQKASSNAMPKFSVVIKPQRDESQPQTMQRLVPREIFLTDPQPAVSPMRNPRQTIRSQESLKRNKGDRERLTSSRKLSVEKCFSDSNVSLENGITIRGSDLICSGKEQEIKEANIVVRRPDPPGLVRRSSTRDCTTHLYKKLPIQDISDCNDDDDKTDSKSDVSCLSELNSNNAIAQYSFSTRSDSSLHLDQATVTTHVSSIHSSALQLSHLDPGSVSSLQRISADSMTSNFLIYQHDKLQHNSLLVDLEDDPLLNRTSSSNLATQLDPCDDDNPTSVLPSNSSTKKKYKSRSQSARNLNK